MDLLANLARANLALADYNAAKPVVAQLQVGYSGQPGFVQRMNEIAWDYHAVRKNEEAEAIYRYIMANLAGDEEAVSSQCALVMLKHSTGDKATAAAELDIFINQFSGNSKKPQFLRKLAYHVYERSKDFETASKLYRLALESTPDAAIARQVRLEYLRTRAMLSTTSAEVEEVLQACVTAVADMAGSNTLHLLPRDSVAAVIGAYATVNPAGDDEPAAIRAANRLVEALGDGASNEQKAIILRIAAHGCDRIKNYQMAVELYDKVMKTTPDVKLAQRVMFEYLTARSKLVKTEAEADEVFQGCLTAMTNMSDNHALLHDAIVAAIRAYLPVKTQRDGMPVSIHAANRLVEAMSGASDYQQAMAQEVRAWAYSWNGQHEKAVQLLLDMVEDFNGNTDEDVAHLCADALGHAYGYTTVYLKDTVTGQKYLDQISSLGSGGRFQAVADLFRKQVDKRAVNQENLGEK